MPKHGILATLEPGTAKTVLLKNLQRWRADDIRPYMACATEFVLTNYAPPYMDCATEFVPKKAALSGSSACQKTTQIPSFVI